MEKIYILTATSHSDGKTEIVGAYHNLADAQKEMKIRYECGKKFWDRMDAELKRNHFDMLNIQYGDLYAEVYVADNDYNEVGMSWNIEVFDVK